MIQISNVPIKFAEDTTMANFNAWLEQEKQKGLVDMKFAVEPRAADNSTTRHVMEEFLRAEKMIAARIVEPHLQEPESEPIA